MTRDCEHKRVRHEHGTYLAYVRDLCRCDPCRAAQTAAEAHRRRQKAYGRWNGLVDAEPAREHVHALSAAGVGLRQITRLTGVSGGVLTKLMYGQPLPDGGRRPPCRRISPRTADRILSIPLTARADGARVDATGTRRRLAALVAIGWSQSKLADRLGMARANFGKTIRAAHVTVATERAVRALYDELWSAAPPEAQHRDKIAASRARRTAREHGWPPPLAWDDDSIDDPEAKPQHNAAGPRELAPCGTLAAHRRHLRHGEPVDEACRKANARREDAA